MSDLHNPYAPPRAALDSGGSGGVWRLGKSVVMHLGAELPHRCVKCNAPAEEPIKERTLYWHTPALYLIALVALLIYAIVALIVRKKATVAPGLCTTHRKRRNLWIAVGCLGPVAGLALAIQAGTGDNCGGMAAGILLLLVSLVTALLMARIVYAERIEGDYVRLRGCGEAFLASLPELPN